MPIRRLNPFRRGYRRPVRRGGWRLADPRFYLKAVIVLAAGLLVVLPWAADGLGLTTGARSLEGCRVARVIDGDTLSLWCPGRGIERVRLLGFDTPELTSPGCPAEFAAALAATWHLRRLLLGAEVLSVRLGGLDRYGRRLATLGLDGQPLAQAMIAAGHARPYGGAARGGWC